VVDLYYFRWSVFAAVLPFFSSRSPRPFLPPLFPPGDPAHGHATGFPRVRVPLTARQEVSPLCPLSQRNESFPPIPLGVGLPEWNGGREEPPAFDLGLELWAFCKVCISIRRDGVLDCDEGENLDSETNEVPGKGAFENKEWPFPPRTPPS